LASIERSPNTVKAYAHDLKDWFTFLGRRGLDWRSAGLEDVAGYVAWLRLPPAARDGRVRVLPSAEHHCSESSVNRKLAALISFCEFHARHGVPLAGLLVTMAPAGGGRWSATSFKPFLHHITKSTAQRRRTIKLVSSPPRPRVLTVSEAQSILDACEHLRDRFLFALLLDTGVRIGEALGLRHEDLAIAERHVAVLPRVNDNRARAKGGRSRRVPASGELMRLYADYLNDEYGSLDSDYVFVNLWGRPHGHPWTYPAVYDLVGRLRRRTRVAFGPHWFRHTYATWLLRCLLRGRARIDFRGLRRQLKLELQYAVQCRADQATITLPPPVVAWTIRQAREAGVASLLDQPAQWWADRAGPKTSSYPAFLAFARDVVETLHEGTGWEVEYPRDVWRIEKLPGLTTNASNPRPRNRLRFDRISQPWLRGLVKRWARLRLSSGLAVGTVVTDVQSLARFSSFLSESVPAVTMLADLDRALLERYLAWLTTAVTGHGAREDAVTGLGMFFQAIRQHGWDPTLPTTAVFFTGDLPRRPSRVTRHLAEHVMAQVEAPANLDRWPHPEARLVTVILIPCGLRATDACTLPFECLLHDGQGAPYLRYFNHKMRREAAVPIDADLETEIRAQQQRVADRWPRQHPHLFPQLKGNAGGQRPLSYYSYRGMLHAWLALCQVHDEHGRPVQKNCPHANAPLTELVAVSRRVVSRACEGVTSFATWSNQRQGGIFRGWLCPGRAAWLLPVRSGSRTGSSTRPGGSSNRCRCSCASCRRWDGPRRRCALTGWTCCAGGGSSTRWGFAGSARRGRRPATSAAGSG
jgi:integrase